MDNALPPDLKEFLGLLKDKNIQYLFIGGYVIKSKCGEHKIEGIVFKPAT